MIVGLCKCGRFVLDTQPRASMHGLVDARAFIGGGEFDVLGKQSGYRPDPAYGRGGSWSAPTLRHLECADG